MSDKQKNKKPRDSVKGVEPVFGGDSPDFSKAIKPTPTGSRRRCDGCRAWIRPPDYACPNCG